jgi:hypothetical protein
MDLLAHATNFSCSFLPNGNLDGSDQLGVAFYFSLLYADVSELDRLVVVHGTSDTGWSISYNSGVNNQATSNAQFSVQQGDFGRSHRVTIEVDADNHYPEVDETNNTLAFTVSLPATRPTSFVEDIPCS